MTIIKIFTDFIKRYYIIILGLFIVSFFLYLGFMKNKNVSKKSAINPGLPFPAFLMSDANGNLSKFEPNITALNSNLTIAGDIKSLNDINGKNIIGDNIKTTGNITIGNTPIDENTLKRIIANTNIITENSDTNLVPNWYRQNYPLMSIKEIKEPNSIQLTIINTKCLLETIIPSANDSLSCIQFAYEIGAGGTGKIAYRYEPSNLKNTWSSWSNMTPSQIVKIGDRLQIRGAAGALLTVPSVGTSYSYLSGAATNGGWETLSIERV